MAITGFAAVLYYGILASVTGGYVPYRVKNWWLAVFHLYLFISFIIFPLVVYLAAVNHWIGWLAYGVLTCATFLVIKITNFRLHKALDMNPEEEDEEEEGGGGKRESDEEKEEEEEKKARRVDSEEEEEERERRELGLDGKEVEPVISKAEEAGITLLPGQVSQEMRQGAPEEDSEEDRENLRKHCDSASTLGQSSTYHSSQETAEMQLLTTSSAREEEREGGGGGEGGEAVESLLGIIEAEVGVRLGKEGREGRGGGEGHDTDKEKQPEGALVVQVEFDSSTSPGQNQSDEKKVPEVSLSQPTASATPVDVFPGLPRSAEWLENSNSSVGLMSPMHHSSTSPLQSSSNIQHYISAIHPASAGGSRTNTLRSSNLQRSVSLPLSHDDGPQHLRGRPSGGGVGEVAGQPDRGAPVLLRVSPMKEDVADSTAVELETSSTYVYHRRAAIRNRRAFSQEVPHLSPYFRPRGQSAGAGSAGGHRPVLSHTARVTLDEEEEEREEERGRRDDEEEDDEEEDEEEEPKKKEETNPLVESVKHKLLEQGHLSLLDVVEKMPTTLHESIVTDSVSRLCLETITHRVPELQTGHLAHNDADSSRGAIHWFEVGGEWNFYVFSSEQEVDEEEVDEEEPELPHHADSDLFMDRIHQEMLSRYGLDLGNLYPSATPPHPPPRPPRTPGGPPEEILPPTYRILPGIKKTSIELKFKRRQLEEFMDRNVTIPEIVVTVVLAVLVCVVAGLLLGTGFYRDFWAFWLCFVVATAHFSLIKSVQSDPASPIPGQNRITAVSRAFYFVLVGIVGLCIDVALNEVETFSPLCAYGFNLNNPNVFIFVRDGLFIFILFFPLLFAWGLLPQADTFIIFLIEQIDMHIFGGTAATGLVCAFYALGRSLLATTILWCLGFLAFRNLGDKRDAAGNAVHYSCTDDDTDPNNPDGQCEIVRRVALSFFCGGVMTTAYTLSRNTSNHEYIWDLLKRLVSKRVRDKQRTSPDNVTDPLGEIYFQTLWRRLLADLAIGCAMFLSITALNLTSVFCRSVIPAYVIYGLTCATGALNHYIIPHLRKEMPWILCAEPIVKAPEWDSYEVLEHPKVTLIERFLQISLYVEKNVFYPLTFLFAINLSALHYQARFGEFGAALVLTVAGLKIFRSSYTELSRQYLVLIFTLFFFNYDYRHLSEGLPLDYLIIAILFNKFYDLLLKMYFIFIYIAPWQISWSSPGHIIAQPLLVPHSPNIFFQTLIASIVGCPINPVVASTFFTISYARPIKYWEKDYNTRRSDSSNTRLDSQLEGNLRNPNPDKLDSLFYEHLTWVLQKSLCGDLMLGRWGRVTSGDFYILTSDRLNALVHIIEIGNGFVTFQLRGLEFRGTYCHQREVEAITESISDDMGCCCCDPGHLPFLLSCNKAFSSRWLAWEVVSSCYTLHGYSIAENQAHLVFNTFDYKRSYVTYYCKSIIYLLIKSPRLVSLLTNQGIREALDRLHQESYVDQDTLFDETRNSDFSHSKGGVSRERFVIYYLPFIRECVNQLDLAIDTEAESFLVTLSFAYTLLGRRMFFQHAQSGSSRRGDNFMNGLYRMFLGDARPNHHGDEWVFQDVDSIQEIIIPAARTALKVHQDNFAFSEEYDSPHGVYEAIQDVIANHVVTHENDRAWRNAVVTNKPSLLALRYQRTEESYIYPYKLIRLTSKFIKFRVIKVNRECVRSLWTSQRQELIFLRNSDSERGSIQNHKPTLRNMINSSMDLPIGYPIYVSPLHTSFLDRHESYNGTLFGKVTDPLWLAQRTKILRNLCDTCVKHYQGSRGHLSGKPLQTSVNPSEEGGALTGGGGGGGVGGGGGGGGAEGTGPGVRSESVDSLTGLQYKRGAGVDGAGGGRSYQDPFPDSDSDSDEQLWRPMWVSKTVVITNEEEIFESINPDWLTWPEPGLAAKAEKGNWGGWRPQKGMEGEVVHEWRPFHKESAKRSHIDKVLVLVKMADNCYILIREQGIKEV